MADDEVDWSQFSLDDPTKRPRKQAPAPSTDAAVDWSQFSSGPPAPTGPVAAPAPAADAPLDPLIGTGSPKPIAPQGGGLSSKSFGAFPRGRPQGAVFDPTEWRPDTSPEHSQAVQEAFDALPFGAKVGTMGDDLLRSAMHGVTAGQNNRFLANVANETGGDYDKVFRTREQADADARIRGPISTTIADALGSYYNPVSRIFPVEAAVQQTVPVLRGVPSTARQILARTGLRGALGAGENVSLNALNQYGHGQDPYEGALSSALFGAGVSGGLTPALTSAAGWLGGRLPGMRVDPMAATGTPPPGTRNAPRQPGTFWDSKNQAYGRVQQYPGYDPRLVRQSVRDARVGMTDLRLNDPPPPGVRSNHPGSLAHIQALEDITNPRIRGATWSGGRRAPTPDDILQERRALIRDTQGNEADATVSAPLRGELEDILRNQNTSNGQNAWADVEAARRANARYKNAALADKWQESEANRPASTDVITGRAQTSLDDQALLNKLTPAEREALRGVARGNWISRTANIVASRPVIGAGVLSALSTGAGALGGGWHPAIAAGMGGALAYPMIVAGARRASRAVTDKALDTFRRVGTDSGPVRNFFAEAVNNATVRDRINRMTLGTWNQ